MQPNFRTIVTCLAIWTAAFAPASDELEQETPQQSKAAQYSYVDAPSTEVMLARVTYSFAGRRVEFSEQEVVLSDCHCLAANFFSVAPFGACVLQVDNGLTPGHLSQGQQSFFELRLTV